MSNSFDPGEMLSYSAELLGVSSGSRLFAYDTLVVIGGLRVQNTRVVNLFGTA